MKRMVFPRPAFLLTLPTGVLVGFFLARQEFGVGFDAAAFMSSAAVLVATIAIYIISLRGFAVGRVFAAAVGWAALVLLGAAVGGGIKSWEIITAAAILGAYCGSVELVAVRAQSRLDTPRKFGIAAWGFSVVAVTSCTVLAVISFATHGIAAASPWVSVWIFLWVSFRSIYCSVLLSKHIAAETASQLAVQLQCGVLLLQGAIITGLIANQTGAIGFVAAMILLSVCNFLDKRTRQTRVTL